MADLRERERLAEAVGKRRHRLGVTQRHVASHGGPSVRTVRAIEAREADKLTDLTMSRLDQGLSWEHGTARDVLHGKLDIEAAISARPVAYATTKITVSNERAVEVLNDLGYDVAVGDRLTIPDPGRAKIVREALQRSNREVHEGGERENRLAARFMALAAAAEDSMDEQSDESLAAVDPPVRPGRRRYNERIRVNPDGTVDWSPLRPIDWRPAGDLGRDGMVLVEALDILRSLQPSDDVVRAAFHVERTLQTLADHVVPTRGPGSDRAEEESEPATNRSS